ncbi:hypothetical protein J6590_005188 [Homalodisca vitripennis]|nr:hypothetical protein J6590_005188 [Homalodisca vitripennis]
MAASRPGCACDGVRASGYKGHLFKGERASVSSVKAQRSRPRSRQAQEGAANNAVALLFLAKNRSSRQPGLPPAISATPVPPAAGTSA